jgi:hypothetical protein
MSNFDFHDFAKSAIDELTIVQGKWHAKYDIDSYSDWFYDQSTGLLTFSSEQRELNFKYFQAGSYSEKSRTWNWAWNNEDTLENVKNASQRIRTFGIKSGFKKLENGFFESDEIEAWEFAAISAQITNGIGVYRPVSDGLQLFLIVTEFVDNMTAQQLKDKFISCNNHGSERIAFVCKHLITRDHVGFEEAFETYENMELEEDDDFQAWCSECEVVRQNNDGWNEVSMQYADIKLVCEKCYFEFKQINLGNQ